MAKQDDRRQTERVKAKPARSGKTDGSARSTGRSGATRSPERTPVAKAVAEVPEWSWTPTGVRRSLDPLIIDADEPRVERGEIKATVSLRKGDELLHHERVNLDWPGGRDKFLRKAVRAVVAAGVVGNPINEAFMLQMRDALRTRSETAAPPVGDSARPIRKPTRVRA